MVKRITFAGLLRAFCADAAHARLIDNFTAGKSFQRVSMRGTDVAGGPNGTGSADAAHARLIDNFTAGKSFQRVSMRGTDVAGGPNGTGSYAFRFDDRDFPENSSIRLFTADEAIEIVEPPFFAIDDALTRAPKIAEFR